MPVSYIAIHTLTYLNPLHCTSSSVGLGQHVVGWIMLQYFIYTTTCQLTLLMTGVACSWKSLSWSSVVDVGGVCLHHSSKKMKIGIVPVACYCRTNVIVCVRVELVVVVIACVIVLVFVLCQRLKVSDGKSVIVECCWS